jgi:hypothetical protein
MGKRKREGIGGIVAHILQSSKGFGVSFAIKMEAQRTFVKAIF